MKQKFALVLSRGGTLGVAHIGALEILEKKFEEIKEKSALCIQKTSL